MLNTIRAKKALSFVCVIFIFQTFFYSFIYADDVPSDVIHANFIEIESSDGHKIPYFEYVPTTYSLNDYSTLIISLHGHGSNCGQIFNGAHNEYIATNDFAKLHNSVVVSPEYGSDTSWMGPKAEKDLLVVLAEQKSKRRYDQIIISGASMGGSSALTFAALHPELIDGVVAMNGIANHFEYENFQDAISDSFGGSKSKVWSEYKKRSPEYFPENFKGIPIAITLGSLDTIVPPDSARRLAHTIKKIGGDVLLIERVDVGHTTPYEEAYRAFEYVFNTLEIKRKK